MPIFQKRKKLTIRDVASTLTAISTISVIFFGVSLASTFERVRFIAKTPEMINKLVKMDSSMIDYIEIADQQHEMMWELFRMMTDDDDTLQWHYATEDGVPRNVDIRSTAEDVELAFVYEVHAIYPVFTSPADGRKYIIRRNGSEEDYITYLFRR